MCSKTNCASSQSSFLQTKQPQEIGLRKKSLCIHITAECHEILLTQPSISSHSLLSQDLILNTMQNGRATNSEERKRQNRQA